MTDTPTSVLLIDDDSLFTDVIGQRLTQQGLECVYAPSGAIAFEILAKRAAPSVILLDVTMPDMSGFEVLKKLKDDEHTAHIPVVMFSNDATPENIAKAKEMGAVEFMEKVQAAPSDVVALVEKVTSAVR